MLAALATLGIEPRQAARRTTSSAGAVALVGLIGAALLHQVVTGASISTAAFRITSATYSQLGAHLVLWLQAIGLLFYGGSGGLPVSLTLLLKLVCTAVGRGGCVCGAGGDPRPGQTSPGWARRPS